MKKILFGFSLILMSMISFGQGLEGMIVEEYPTSIPGYTTYRVFIDLAEGYSLSAVFSDANHNLIVETSGELYNETSLGKKLGLEIDLGTADLLGKRYDLFHDSYWTIGAFTTDQQGVLLTEEPAGDGYVDVAPTSTPTLDVSDFLDGFGKTMGAAPFSYSSGGLTRVLYATPAVNGEGPSNSVLIGQFTVSGDFTIEVPVSILQDGVAGANKFVPSNPVGTEIEFAGLRYSNVNEAPVVTLNALTSTSFFEGETVSGSAVASDDGSVAQVEFFIDGVSITVDNAAPYEFSAPVGAVGAHSITAEVTDDMGMVVASTNTLNYTVATNATPVAVVTGPVGPIDITSGAQTLNLTADATDTELDPIAGVEFFVNGSSVGTDATAPYEVSYTFSLAGTYEITAQASDASRQGPMSAPVSVNVVNNAEFYYLGAGPSEGFTQSVPCYEGDQFCVKIMTAQAMTDLTGFDIVMKFDADKVRPTGHVALNAEVHTANYLDADFKMNVKGDSLFLTIFFNDAQASDVWTGEGTIACVYFAKNESFSQNDAVEFSITKFRESTLIKQLDGTYYVDRTVGAINIFTFETFLDPIFNAYVAFWSDMSPVPGQANDASYNSTFLRDGLGSAFGNEADENGMVAYNWVTNGAKNLRVDKDVDNTVFDEDVILSLIGGQDALITARFLVDYYELNGWYPTAYQVMAMDVNLDGKVTAGDLTEINKRAVQSIQEFSEGADWLSTTLSKMNSPQYQPSSAFPLDAGAGAGYSKERVPQRSVLTLDIAEDSCQFIDDETFVMILLGDVDGSFKEITAPATGLKSLANNSVLFDLANATYEENFIDVPVRLSGEGINAFDFAIMVNTDNLQFMSVNNMQQVEALSNSIDQNVWNTSYSFEDYNTEEPVFSVRFMTKGSFSNDDFTYASAFINGVKVETSFTKAAPTQVKDAAFADLRIYPNPASEYLIVESATEANIKMIDMNGRVIFSNVVLTDRAEINVADLSAGIYFIKIENEETTKVEKVVIR